MDAIIATFPIEFDASEHALNARAAGFAARQQRHNRVFKGVIGAVDGLLVKIRCPWASEVGMPRSFYSRKGFFAINASINPPDEELILPLPTELEAPSNHLTGRHRRTTLVLVVILATMATLSSSLALLSLTHT